jgi:Tfp pilus assembly protein PilV
MMMMMMMMMMIMKMNRARLADNAARNRNYKCNQHFDVTPEEKDNFKTMAYMTLLKQMSKKQEIGRI